MIQRSKKVQDALDKAKTEFNAFTDTLSEESQEKLTTIKSLMKEYLKTIDDKKVNEEVKDKMTLLRGEIAVEYLTQFCSNKEHAEETYKLLKDKSIINLIVTNPLSWRNNPLKNVKETLAYPDHQCWDYCIPLKGNVEYDNRDGGKDIMDLGIVNTGGEWSAAIVYGKEDHEYMSGHCFWLSSEWYKDTFELATRLGIFDDDSKMDVLKNYGLDKLIFRSKLNYHEIKEFIENQNK